MVHNETPCTLRVRGTGDRDEASLSAREAPNTQSNTQGLHSARRPEHEALPEMESAHAGVGKLMQTWLGMGRVSNRNEDAGG